jgi:tetratricopeptide (TPR) repeat protein
MDSIDTLWNQALAAYRDGKAQEAADACSRLLAARPDHVDALLMLGSILMASGDAAAARARLESAAAVNPESPAVHNALGAAYYALGDLQLAAEEFGTAVRIRPTMAEAQFHLGTTLHALGRTEEAVAAYRKAVAMRPNFPDAHNRLGLALTTLGRADAALPFLQKAVQYRPDFSDAICNLAVALRILGRIDEAKEWCRRGIERCPDSAGSYANLGVMLSEENPEESVRLLLRAFELDPGPVTRNNVSVQHMNIGASHLKQGDSATAIACFERAVEVDPSNSDAYHKLWNCFLDDDDYERGFPAYNRWMEECRKGLRGDKPRWDGSPMPNGTLVVYAHHGSGDALQMLRYLPAAAERSGAAIVFEGPLEVLPLAANMPCVQSVVERNRDFRPPDVEYDADIDLGSLGSLFYTSRSTLPSPPYVAPTPDRVSAWRDKLQGREELRVGICWTGDPTNALNASRSCRLAELVEAISIRGVEIFSLQVRFGLGQLEELPALRRIKDVGMMLRDFNETAAAVANLDLVITIETATAHLAGALGHPCWTLLANRPAWMWGKQDDSTPWYPGMRLFRQQEPGDWSSALSRVTEELTALVRDR